MPKLTEIQNSTIKLLDYLYFHDVLSLETFSDEKLEFYKKLTKSLHVILNRRKYKGLRAEHYKHLLLTGIDLNISYISSAQKTELIDSEEFIRAFKDEICSEVSKANFCLGDFDQDLQNLLDQHPIDQLSSALHYKIVSQVLSYDYDNIAIGVFSKFIDYQFLNTSKYRKLNQKMEQEYLDRLFLRAMLFIEFEVFKNNLLLSNLKGEKIVDLNNLHDHEKVIAIIKSKAKMEALKKVDYERIYSIDLNKKNDLDKYFTNVEERLGHNPIFTDNLATWVSLIGAWHLMLVKKTNLDKPLYREVSIHVLDAEPTCSEIAKEEMLEYGFTISERTLFDYHNRIFEFYRLVRIVVDGMNEEGMYGVLEPVLTHYFFYDPNVGDGFRQALQKVNANLKN
ncbi:hypothetical protein [Acinetobacter sp. ANC 3791]|uniref:hypothetical protein n=1 Tax=Acinetobacter sp. ANC 3791 TaxID=2529836 RepID=UPI00103F4002|nr:hypothetical protein [Acinetobacter sp. ANC 3791]TCB84111.1 hypothetical protein E0H90_08775 [Acinetobacter sp. ANC 3791]